MRSIDNQARFHEQPRTTNPPIMQDNRFFDKLLLLPLFQGIGRNDFWEIAEQIKIGFHKQRASHVIAKQGELCEKLHFVMNGTLRMERDSDNHQYTLHEWYDKPTVLQPECLFGLTTRYTRTYHADTDIQYFEIDKSAVREVLFYYPTFRINYLNMLSGMIQTGTKHLWHTPSPDLLHRFISFVTHRSMRPAGKKTLYIDMPTLATELLATRLNVSKMLNHLAEQDLLELHRKRIIIPQLEKLIQSYP